MGWLNESSLDAVVCFMLLCAVLGLAIRLAIGLAIDMAIGLSVGLAILMYMAISIFCDFVPIRLGSV